MIKFKLVLAVAIVALFGCQTPMPKADVTSTDPIAATQETRSIQSTSEVKPGQPGGKCKSSLDCPSSSFCRNGFCDAPIMGCIAEGGVCKSSLDCCKSMFCHEDSKSKLKLCK